MKITEKNINRLKEAFVKKHSLILEPWFVKRTIVPRLVALVRLALTIPLFLRTLTVFKVTPNLAFLVVQVSRTKGFKFNPAKIMQGLKVIKNPNDFLFHRNISLF